jgi:hypothetical protein
MVSNCANPECGKPLHYLRDGKIFQLHFRSADNKNVTKRVEHFWLCGDCSVVYDVRQAAAGVEVVPLGRTRMPQRMLIDAA